MELVKLFDRFSYSKATNKNYKAFKNNFSSQTNTLFSVLHNLIFLNFYIRRHVNQRVNIHF